MKWKVLRQTDGDTFAAVTDDPALPGCTLVDGVNVYEDGFSDDASDWGDDESNAISNQQQTWQAADPDNRLFACSWIVP